MVITKASAINSDIQLILHKLHIMFENSNSFDSLVTESTVNVL